MKPALRRGARAAHGEIVYRAVNREGSDVAARKEQRLHHERIGRKSQPRAADVEDRLVVQAVEQGIREQRQKDVVQQLGAQLPPLPWPSTTRSLRAAAPGKRTE